MIMVRVEALARRRIRNRKKTRRPILNQAPKRSPTPKNLTRRRRLKPRTRTPSALRALLQRVSQAAVSIAGESTRSIDAGLVVLVGIGRNDGERDAIYVVDKTVNLRIFDDSDGKFHYSALDKGAELLVISQFTLYGATQKGRRPSFTDAAHSEDAEVLFKRTLQLFADTGLRIETGKFQAHMSVEIHNDGPVTVSVDSEQHTHL